MTLLFSYQQFSSHSITHLAVGTSLASIVLTAFYSVKEHHRYGAVQWDLVKRFIPGIVLGVVIGALTADSLAGQHLRLIIGSLAILMALQLIFPWRWQFKDSAPPSISLTIASVVIGVLSSLSGIGGGSLTVPYLTAYGIKIPLAIATAAACGLPIALAGTVSYILVGWNAVDLPAWSSGYVYWPAALAMVSTSMMTAGYGAKLTHKMPVTLLRRIFAVMLLGIGIKFIMGSY